MTATLAGYQLQLPTFEGPLDVLLSLIERDRLEISDLSLVAVTDGFLTYIAEMHDPPPALLAEFAGVAARLLLLKSRSLLPRPPVPEQEPEVGDLAAQLREYQRVRHVAESLREIQQTGQRSFVRPLATDLPPPMITLIPPPLADLRKAFLRSLARATREPDVAPLRRVISIGDMIGRLRARLTARCPGTRFRELVGTTDREATAVGFIALLALLRRGEVDVVQTEVFGDIHVTPVPGRARSGADE